MRASKWFVFVLVAIAQFMVVLDTSITNVALPTIKDSLHFTSDSTLQWVVTAYALTFGGFLLLGGRFADLYGRKKTLLIGMAAFTVCSAAIGFATSPAMLIGLRALQGLSAALMSPSALSIVLVSFQGGKERNQAIGYWSLVSTGGAAVGLLLGGVLTEYLGWRWNFFVNVPVGLLMLVLIGRAVPAHESESTNRTLDILGAILVTGGLVTFVYATSRAADAGWTSVSTVGLLVTSVILLALFIFNEMRVSHPIMPLDIFKERNVVGANLMIAPVFATMFGMFFLVSLYVQQILHYSPVKTGLCFLPVPILIAFMSTRMPGLVGRYGYRRFLIIGPCIIAVALMWISTLPVQGSYLKDLLPALLVLPIGLGMTIMPIIAAATSGVPPERSGLASGLVNTSQQMGGALGLAILSTIAASTANAAAPGNILAAVVHGYDRAFVGALLFIAFGVTIAITVIRQKQPQAASPALREAPSAA